MTISQLALIYVLYYTHIDNHFTALAGANLTKELHDEGLGHIS